MPTNEKRPAGHGAASTTTTECTEYIAGLHRRRTAASRSTPLDCGCRDPWPCRHHDRQSTRGVVEAAGHLAELGLPPLFRLDTCRALWPDDRELAVTLARLRGAA